MRNAFANKYNGSIINEQAYQQALKDGNLVMIKTSDSCFYKVGYMNIASFLSEADDEVDKY